jgi:co-chaperonin GroES (HSP10)
VLSAGNLVKDIKIKGSKGDKILFHKGVGQEIEYDGETYLVLEDIHILAVV